MTTTLSDVNTHLFNQLEALSNTNLKGEALKEEIDRSKAMTDVCKSVAENASLQLQAMKIEVEHKGYRSNTMPKTLRNNSEA